MSRDGAADLRNRRTRPTAQRSTRWRRAALVLKRAAGDSIAITAADFLGYLLNHGDPNQGRAWASSVKAKAREGADPHYLIYWFVEGGWASYDMFSPVESPNNVITRLPLEQISKERYRVLKWGEPGYTIQTRQHPLRVPGRRGKDLFPEAAVLASMHTGSFHSGERLKTHMGSYNLRLRPTANPMSAR